MTVPERSKRAPTVSEESAEGAEYYSQGQARSASPLVTYIKKRRRGLKGRNIIPPFQGWRTVFINRTRGDALRACPWLSYFAPSALLGPTFIFAPLALC